MFRSLTGKLVTTYLVIILAVLLVIGSAVYRLVLGYFIRSAQQDLLWETQQAAALYTRVLDAQESAAASGRPGTARLEAFSPENVVRLAAELTRSEVMVLDASGQVVYDSRGVKERKVPVVPAKVLAGLRAGDPPKLLRRDDVQGRPAAATAVKLKTAPKTQDLYLFMRKPFTGVQGSVRGVLRVLLQSGLLAAAITVAFALFLARGLSRPIVRLTEAARRLAAGELGVRTGVRGSDEIGVLGQSFDDMGERLSRLVATINTDRQRFQAILHGMDDGLISLDLSGKVLFLNPRFARLLGLPKGEPGEGKDFREIMKGEPEMGDLVAQALERRQPFSAELLVQEGTVRLIAHVTPYGASGGSTALLIVVQDVTELRQLEKARLDFISSVSHELRTPVTSIQGFSEALAEGVVGSTEDQRRCAGVINSEARRLRRLIDDLFQFARIEAGQMDFRFEPLNLAEVLRNAVAAMIPQAEEAGVALTVETPDKLGPMLGDRDRLSQVFLNLVGNALRFTHSGGRIAVTGQHDGQTLVIRVADTGTGISPEDLPHIFDRYYKSNRGGRRAGGTGLGLAIAKHIVEAHGGRISVASEEGKGSTFTVRLEPAH